MSGKGRQSQIYVCGPLAHNCARAKSAILGVKRRHHIDATSRVPVYAHKVQSMRQ